MSDEERAELLCVLIRQLIDAAALNHYYANLLRPLLKREPKRWAALTRVERDGYTDAALTQMQGVLAELGWGMEIGHLRELVQS